MRSRIALLGAIGLLALSTQAVFAANPPTAAFGGPVDGSQEVPPVVTAATGEATVVISADNSTIWYVVEYSGLSGSLAAAHIHVGASGANGGVILPLVASASPMVGSLTSSNFTPSGAITTFAEAVAAIKAGGTYVNLHTAANPGGEVRGQVVAKGSAHFGTLSGAQEVPPLALGGSGSAWVVVSTDGSTLTYYVSYAGLSGAAAAAHIHLGAAGANGGVLFPLAVGPSPFVGTLTASDLTPTGSVADMPGAVAAIAAGGTYINVHTAANPGGELRAQLAVTVAAAPSVPPTSTPITGDQLVVGSLPALLGLMAAVAVGAMLLPRRIRLARKLVIVRRGLFGRPGADRD